ncbi:MerR family DNA-binding transcriptional regulator [Sphingomonas sp. MMS24-J13]
MNMGQVSKASGISRRMVRHYEEIGRPGCPILDARTLASGGL